MFSRCRHFCGTSTVFVTVEQWLNLLLLSTKLLSTLNLLLRTLWRWL
jgi:hypothetical protein